MKSTWRVRDDAEVSGEWRTNGRRSSTWINLLRSLIGGEERSKSIPYLVIDQAPLLEECVNSHNGTDVPGKIPPTCRYREILCRVQTVCVDHEVTIVLVDRWSFAPVSAVKELWQSLSLKLVDVVHVEPGAITR